MDDRALQALVAVLQADHALHVGRRCLRRGQAECDWSLRELLATLRREVTHNFSLRNRDKNRVHHLFVGKINNWS